MLTLKCAAVLAKRWQSAAHCSTDSVAGRVRLFLSFWGYQSSSPSADPPCSTPSRARPAIGASINKLFLATFVMTTCWADLMPGNEF